MGFGDIPLGLAATGVLTVYDFTSQNIIARISIEMYGVRILLVSLGMHLESPCVTCSDLRIYTDISNFCPDGGFFLK